MKKLAIVCITALVIPAGGVFGQVIPWHGFVPSEGNSVQIEQIGSGNNVQGAAGTASLDQKVNDSISVNAAEIYQGHNDAGTVYSSTNSTAGLSQTAGGGAQSLSQTLQFGTSQSSSITQDNAGPGSYLALARQGTRDDEQGVYADSARNQATIRQQVAANGDTFVHWPFYPGPYVPANLVAAAIIDQLGQDSTASITQGGAGALAGITQRNGGSWNNAAITQSDNASNTAFVHQYGSYGHTEVRQSGALGLTNSFAATQYSSNSKVSVDQYGSLGSNTSNITQNAGAGFDEAHVIQNSQSANTNTATITQQDGAYAYVDQQSTVAANTATVNQTGANTANVRQR